MQRLQDELDALEAELKMLEREETQSYLFGQETDSRLQLQEVEFLRLQMRNVADSDPFKASTLSESALKNPRKKIGGTGNYDEQIS